MTKPELRIIQNSPSRKKQAEKVMLNATYPIALTNLLELVQNQGFDRVEALQAFYSLRDRRIKEDREWIVHKLIDREAI